MSEWREDLSTSSLQEVLEWQAENRTWSKELRLRANALVNNRLAKNISLDDYLSNRKVGTDEAAECRRRAAILQSQLVRHASGPGRDN